MFTQLTYLSISRREVSKKQHADLKVGDMPLKTSFLEESLEKKQITPFKVEDYKSMEKCSLTACYELQYFENENTKANIFLNENNMQNEIPAGEIVSPGGTEEINSEAEWES